MWGDVPGKAFPHLLLHELLLLPAPLVHRTGAELTACHTSRPPVQYPISASMIKALTRGTGTTSVSVSFSDQPSFLPSVVRGHVWMVRREQRKPFLLYFSLPFV